jgi:hypothetical protein
MVICVLVTSGKASMGVLMYAIIPATIVTSVAIITKPLFFKEKDIILLTSLCITAFD